MSIATRADTSRDRPAHLVAGVATSALDRVLAPLADLGAALREEIAASLAPLAAELGASLKQVSTLEARVRDLETRLAGAAAALGAARPGARAETLSLSTEAGTVAGRHAPAETPTRRKRQRRRPVQDGSIEAPAPVGPMAVVPPTLLPAMDAPVLETPVRAHLVPPIDNPATQAAKPADATTSVPPMPEAAAGMASEPSPSIVATPILSGERAPREDERRGNGPTSDERPETGPGPGRAEPEPATSGPPHPAVSPSADTGEATGVGARAAPRDRAAGILNPLLEQGAREMIAFGLYPDMEALLNEAVFRLIESDYPSVPDG
jgi:hypothetical protein